MKNKSIMNNSNAKPVIETIDSYIGYTLGGNVCPPFLRILLIHTKKDCKM